MSNPATVETPSLPTGKVTITSDATNTILASLQITADGFQPLTKTNLPVVQNVPLVLQLTPNVVSNTVMAKIVAFIAKCWNNEVGLWSTSLQSGNITYAGITVKISNLFWYSSEAELYVPIMYENGFAANALTAKNLMLASNPWRGVLRDQICYGALIPDMQVGSNNSHVKIKSGTLANGETYLVMADESTGFNNIGLVWNANGDIAYQAINSFIRGDTVTSNKLIDTIEAAFDGFGFNTGSSTYQTRGLGMAGLAILVCGYDPKGLMPAMNVIVTKLQGSDGSFPNSYDKTLTAGIGDAESCNRIACWYCPKLIAFLVSLKGTANKQSPPMLNYSPPSYIV